jgi:glycine/D-amino acid oxidase-like deaminating enzyme
VGGGGIVGPSSAYYLVERGAAVTSVEVTDVLLRNGVVAGVGTTEDPSTPRSW